MSDELNQWRFVTKLKVKWDEGFKVKTKWRRRQNSEYGEGIYGNSSDKKK